MESKYILTLWCVFIVYLLLIHICLDDMLYLAIFKWAGSALFCLLPSRNGSPIWICTSWQTSGDTKAAVGFVFDKALGQRLENSLQVNDRILTVRIKSKPYQVTLMRQYNMYTLMMNCHRYRLVITKLQLKFKKRKTRNNTC